MIERKSFFQLGYQEASKKPKLYYKSIPPLVFFIDLRGDSFDHRFYYKTEEDIKEEEKEKITNLVLKEYGDAKKSYYGRDLGFWNLCDCGWCGKDLLEEFALIGADVCGDGATFCSEGCMRMMKKDRKKFNKLEVKEWKKLRCPLCKKLPELENKEFPIDYGTSHLHDHHTNYREGEEKTIKICSSCHAKITLHPEKYPPLKKYLPEGTRKEMLEKKKTDKDVLHCTVCNKAFTDKRRAFCSDECKERFRIQEEEKKPKRVKRIYGNYDKDSRRSSWNWYKRS
jgi:predicted nucleic acid-binding Zn ribbon protein